VVVLIHLLFLLKVGIGFFFMESKSVLPEKLKRAREDLNSRPIALIRSGRRQSLYVLVARLQAELLAHISSICWTIYKCFREANLVWFFHKTNSNEDGSQGKSL
jgi:hypothetical protein